MADDLKRGNLPGLIRTNAHRSAPLYLLAMRLEETMAGRSKFRAEVVKAFIRAGHPAYGLAAWLGPVAIGTVAAIFMAILSK